MKPTKKRPDAFIVVEWGGLSQLEMVIDIRATAFENTHIFLSPAWPIDDDDKFPSEHDNGELLKNI